MRVEATAMRIAVLAPGVVPGAADRLRRDRVGRLAARRRARRRRARRDALRLGRLAHEGEARVRLRGGAERARSAARFPELQHALHCYARAGRVRRDQRPHRACSALTLGGARRDAGRAHGARPARRRARRALRAVVARRAERRADLDLDEPAQAEARPELDRELPERARLLRSTRARRTAATTCSSSAG